MFIIDITTAQLKKYVTRSDINADQYHAGMIELKSRVSEKAFDKFIACL